MKIDFGEILLAIILTPIVIAAVHHFSRAYVITNSKMPFNPPDQLYVNKDNQWATKPSSERVAWWRSFCQELTGKH